MKLCSSDPAVLHPLHLHKISTPFSFLRNLSLTAYQKLLFLSSNQKMTTKIITNHGASKPKVMSWMQFKKESSSGLNKITHQQLNYMMPAVIAKKHHHQKVHGPESLGIDQPTCGSGLAHWSVSTILNLLNFFQFLLVQKPFICINHHNDAKILLLITYSIK